MVLQKPGTDVWCRVSGMSFGFGIAGGGGVSDVGFCGVLRTLGFRC